MGTETWIISLPLSDSILYLKIIHPPNFREEPILFELLLMITSLIGRDPGFRRGSPFPPLLYYFSNSFLRTYP